MIEIMKGYIDLEFVDKATGEKFFVELNSDKYLTHHEMQEVAMQVAQKHYESPEFVAWRSPKNAHLTTYYEDYKFLLI